MTTKHFSGCIWATEKATAESHDFSWGREPRLTYYRFVSPQTVTVQSLVQIADGCSTREGFTTSGGLFCVIDAVRYKDYQGKTVTLKPVNAYPYYFWSIAKVH